MVKGALNLALVAIFACTGLFSSVSSDKACEVDDGECQAKTPKSGAAMLQFKKEAILTEAEQVAHRSGKKGGDKDKNKKKGKEGDKDKKKGKGGDKDKKKGKGGGNEAKATAEVEDELFYYDYFDVEKGEGQLFSSCSDDVENEADFSCNEADAVEDVNPRWIWDLDVNGVDLHTVTYSPDQDGKAMEAYVTTPTCKEDAPTDGFPAIVIIPGSGNKKRRHTFWTYYLASNGFVAMCIDIEKRGTAINDAVDWIRGDEAQALARINVNRVSLLGYSAGAFTVLSRAFGTEKQRNSVHVHIVVSGVQEDEEEIYEVGGPTLLVQAKNDAYFDGASGWTDHVYPWIQEQNRTTHNLKLMAYTLGSHQPFQNSNFWYEVSKFIEDPSTYVPPAGDEGDHGEFNIGNNPSTWITKHSELGCMTNDDGIEPMMYADNWNGGAGQRVCAGYCKQTKGCVAFDWLSKRLDDDLPPPQENANCVLFSQSCENPTHVGGSHYVIMEDYPHAPHTAFCKPPTPAPPTIAPTAAPTILATPAPTHRDLSVCEFHYLEEDLIHCPEGEEIVTAGECMQLDWEGYEWKGEKDQTSQAYGCIVQYNSLQVLWNAHESDSPPKSEKWRRLCARCR